MLSYKWFVHSVNIKYNCGGQKEPIILISRLLLRTRRMCVASIHLDFH